jgi:toxin-antitoxin system PIN domain toxin
VIALDTNILVYAHRQETRHHGAAVELVRGLAEGDEPWGLPWPCVYEFLRVVTHPRIFDPPTDLEIALDDVESLLDSPSVMLLGEGPVHFAHLARAIESGRAVGNLVHDAHIAALAVEHGLAELWTTDRDFARFSDLPTRNPFLQTDLGERRGSYRPSPRRRRARRAAPAVPEQ